MANGPRISKKLNLPNKFNNENLASSDDDEEPAPESF